MDLYAIRHKSSGVIYSKFDNKSFYFPLEAELAIRALRNPKDYEVVVKEEGTQYWRTYYE